MVRRTFGWAVGLVGLLSFLYLFFFVPLGQRTLWQHAQRIAATEPAHELGADLRTAGERLGGEVRGAATQLSTSDAGVP